MHACTFRQCPTGPWAGGGGGEEEEGGRPLGSSIGGGLTFLEHFVFLRGGLRRAQRAFWAKGPLGPSAALSQLAALHPSLSSCDCFLDKHADG